MMGSPREFPTASLAFAALASIIVAAVSEELVLGLVVFGLWAGSLWLVPTAAPSPDPEDDPLRVGQDSMRALIENSSLPLLLLDRGRIAIANSAARELLGRHVVGQDVRIALRHPAAINLLDSDRGGRVTFSGLTGPQSIWQMARYPVSDRHWMIELVNRTAETDISRAHTDFVANASHELRTPLSSIIGYVETLAETDAPDDPQLRQRFLDTVLREARRLQQLISDLMSLSRIEAEKHDLPSEIVDVGEIVASSSRDAAREADRQRLEFALASEPVRMRGDRQQLEQLVRNLVENALKYGDAAEAVTISLRIESPNRAILTVEDHGEGIAPEHLPHLTRRFYRTDTGRSRQAGGTGLGLAIVKHIVERHRGRLDISSEQGLGTCVTVRLPIVSPEDGGPA